ncbi:MAG: hypothetical protein WAO98_03150 [Alphaproteobacteria bacterium]
MGNLGGFGLVFVAPLWGLLSVHLIYHGILFFVGFFIHFIALFKNRIPRKHNVQEMVACLFYSATLLALFVLGFWVLSERFNFKIDLDFHNAENVVYWIFCAFAVVYLVPQIPTRLEQIWREATEPGMLDRDIFRRKVK